MLTKLAVANFQSWEQADIELAPFTVIVGASNSGKSALRRALEAVTTNAPATGRLRTGSDHIVVDIEVDHAHSVRWEKGGKRNAYLVEHDGMVLTQDKPGSSSTPEVDELLGLDALNFVDQFQPPYLLTETPAGAAKALGALTNVTVLYDGIKEATKRQRNHGSTATVLEKQLAQAQDELADFAWLPAEADALNLAAAALAEAKTAGQTYTQLQNDFATAHQMATDIATAAAELASLPDAATALALTETAAGAVAEAGALAQALDRAQRLQSWIAEPLPAPAPDVSAAVDAAAQALTLRDAAVQARALLGTVETHAAAAEDAAAIHGAAKAALAAIDICPLCQQPAHLEAV